MQPVSMRTHNPELQVLAPAVNISPLSIQEEDSRSTSGSNLDPEFHGSVHTATLAVSTVLVIFVLFLGTFGNGLVILSALRCRKLRSNFDLFIYNLATTDFIMCAFLSPIFLYVLFSQPPSPREFCGGFLFTCTSCGMLSLLTLVAVATHRQSRVRGKVREGLSTTKAACILSLVYTISLGVALGATLHVTLSWESQSNSCQSILNSKNIFKNNVVLFFISPVIIFSVFIILISYSVIARAVKLQTYLRIKTLQPVLKSTALKRNQSSNDSIGERKKLYSESVHFSGNLFKKEKMLQCYCCSCSAALDKETKAFTMCLVVVLIIALCWTPLAVSHVVEIFTGESIILYQVKLCGIALVFLNSALNPYMYAQSSGKMKQKYAKFFWDCLRCECYIPNQPRFRTLSGLTNLKQKQIGCVASEKKTEIAVKPKYKIYTEKELRTQKIRTVREKRNLYQNNLIHYNEYNKEELQNCLSQIFENKCSVSHNVKRAHGQTNVKNLVHKTCCHGNVMDDQSLLES